MLQKWLMLFCFIVVTTVAFAQPPTLGTYLSATIATAGRNAVVTPSAAPTNVGTIHAYTSPDFRGILAVNPTTGAVTVTNAQPAGTYTVTVKSFNGILTALSSFTLRVNNTFCNQGLLSNSISIAAPNKVYAVATGDFNGDGKQDFVTSNGYYPATGLSIRLGDGAGNFTAAPDIPISGSNNTTNIIVNDFNGDGKQDIAVLILYGSIQIISGNGDGTFNSNQVTVFVGDNPSSIATGDFNSDGKPDLAITNGNNNNVSIRLGNGAGAFTAAPNVSVGSYPNKVIIADFNNDGKADMIIVNGSSNNVSVRLGDGNGNFTGTTNFPVGDLPLGIAVADFNSDGNQDCIVICNNGLIGLLPGNGAGSFGSVTNSTTYTGGGSVITGDFNGDGKPDIVITNRSVGKITIRLGDGTGNFTPTPETIEPVLPGYIANGDFNNDGRQDILYCGQTNNAFIRLGSANLAEINVRGNGITINNGDLSPGAADFTDFGASSSTVTHTFVIENTGTGALPVNSIVILGTDSAMFSTGGITIPKTLPAGASDTFTVTFTPIATGIKNAIINIDNNDCSEKIYDFAITGNGVASTVSLGSYPATNIAAAGSNQVINPMAAPANAASITATTTTSAFKGLIQVNTTTGRITVSNAYPAGTYTVLVRASNGFTSATTSFVLTVNTYSGCNPGVFTNAPDGTTEPVPVYVVAADFNNDGNLDYATANSGSDKISIRLGNGTGAFSGTTSESVGLTPLCIAAGDFNGDGNQDLAVVNQISNSVSIRLGNGVGGFAGTTELSVGQYPVHISTGDFNNDGKMDLAVTNSFSSSVSIRLGNSAGGFYGNTEIAVGSYPYGAYVGDFNNDNIPDLAVSNTNSNTVSIRLGDGAGGFMNGTELPIGNSPKSLVIADFNNDGNQDFAVVSNFGVGIIIRLGNGSGGFTAAATINVATGLAQLVSGDFNSDGKPDLASVVPNSAVVAIRFGTGTGTFAAAVTTATGVMPNSIATGDFNNDGRQDFIAADTVAGGKIVIRLANVNEINVLGKGVLITDGSSTPSLLNGTDFGNVSAVDSARYIIQNMGAAPLTISGAVVSGTDSAMFRITGIIFPVAIASGDSLALPVRFKPTSAGLKTAVITINNNDCDEAVYDFAIQGTGVAVMPLLGTYAVAQITTSGNAVIAPSATPVNVLNAAIYTTANFKGILHVNPTTGMVSITNAQPAGTYPITVMAYNGFTSAITSFSLIVGKPACSQALFTQAANISVTALSRSIAVADFNGDGNQDLAAVNSVNTGTVSVSLGNGTGGFSTTNVTVGTAPFSIAAGDFNGDAKQDFVTANYNGSNVSVRLGNVAGSFSSAANVPAGTNPYSIAVADFNNDGKLDLAVSNFGSNTVSICLGDGDGGFTGTTNVAVGNSPIAVITADFNGDGNADFAAANAGANTISIRLGDGAGGFSTVADLSSGIYPISLAVGDFNNDGKPDIAVANNTGNTISVCTGNGTGGFTVISIAVAQKAYYINSGDLNGDGYTDLIVSFDNNSIALYTGNGAGGFTFTRNIDAGTFPRATAVCDVNNDGRQDLAVCNSSTTSTYFTAIRLGADKEINVLGNNATIANGSNTPDALHHTEFDSTFTGTTTNRTFTIQNTGIDTLTISSIIITGADSSAFIRGGIILPALIPAGTSQTFTVTFSPSDGGLKSAQVNVMNNDCDESVYDFAIKGKAKCTALSAPNRWLGVTPNWNAAYNWSLGVVPNGCGIATVNSGTPFMPQISTPNAICYQLILNNGAAITIATGGYLTITGP